jgi:hypothetical protein
LFKSIFAPIGFVKREGIFYHLWIIGIMSKQKLKILVAGHITHDDYNGELLPGGSAYYCSRAYLELGADVLLATSVGKDFRFPDVFNGVKVFCRFS